jgi:serine/threonine protein kinase
MSLSRWETNPDPKEPAMDAILKKCLPTYRIVREIGSGIYGSVYHVRDELKERAVKVVPIQIERSLGCRNATDLDSRVSQDFHAVREYYERIKGDGVVDVHDFHLVDRQVTDRHASASLVILMELCPANLHDHVLDLFPLDPERLVSMMAFLARTLERLTDSMPNVYLLSDLKPSNLLIDNRGQPIIGDLGGLKRLSSQSTASNAQFTPNWSAPELILQGSRPNMRSMIYSFGLVSYFMWEGRLPYPDTAFSERVHRIKDDGLQFFRDDMSVGLAELMIQCTAFHPQDRPCGFGEILERVESEEDALPVDRSPVVRAEALPVKRPSSGGQAPVAATTADGSRSGSTSRSRRPASSRTWQEPGVGMPFVWIDCAGSGWSPEEVQDGGFWMGRYPVTQKEWLAVMGSNPAHFRGGHGLAGGAGHLERGLQLRPPSVWDLWGRLSVCAPQPAPMAGRRRGGTAHRRPGVAPPEQPLFVPAGGAQAADRHRVVRSLRQCDGVVPGCLW